MNSLAVGPGSRDNGAQTPLFARFYRKLFSDVPERSLRVRVLCLLASLWAAASLVLVGASFIVPLASMPFFVLGHVVAYKALRRRIPGLPVIIAIIIIVVGVTMRHELVLAVRGERVPVAHFLLIAGAASVFEARTRAGLFTQLFFAGLVMFFASELAFGNEFVLLIAVFMALIVAFIATTQYTDITRGASVVKRGGPGGGAAFWGMVGVMVVAASVIAFLLLPWDNSQAPGSGRFAILPVSGSQSGQEAAMTPQEARDLLERMAQQAAQGGAAGGEDGEGGMVDIEDLVGGGSGGQQAAQGGGTTFNGPRTPLEAPDLEEGTVAHIRSAVASYWRSAVYDSFDADRLDGAGQWMSTMTQRQRLGSLFARPDDEAADDRYLQTFFMQQDLGQAFLSGYEPRSISIPRDENGRPVAMAGSTYQVVSGTPAITPEDLRQDRAGWAAREYGVLPPEYADMYRLARALTEGAETDFDRAAAIAAYLNSLEYDAASEAPLTSSAPLMDFVLGNAPGSAIDFATAQALMSRAVGLQSRVATGFLPGRYNPYSGAAEVREKDLHAWAEVLFERAGWVPFDASSRPDLPTPSSIETPPSSALTSLLDRRVGGGLASAIGEAPGGLRVAFEWLATKGGPVVALVSLLITAASAFAAWWLFFRNRTVRRRSGRLWMPYTALGGDDRRQVLKEFRRLEKRLAKAGFRRRRENEPFAVYAERAGMHLLEGREEVVRAADLASAAAYSESARDEGAAGEMRSLVKSTRLRPAVG